MSSSSEVNSISSRSDFGKFAGRGGVCFTTRTELDPRIQARRGGALVNSALFLSVSGRLTAEVEFRKLASITQPLLRKF